MTSLLILAAILALFLIGAASLTHHDNKTNLTKAEKQELEQLRNTMDHLTGLVMDNMDVEPFARVVWDEIRERRQKGIR